MHQGMYTNFGVETHFEGAFIRLVLARNHTLTHLTYDLTEAPDLAQTLVVSCFGLGVSCELSGLHTLKIKETDRLQALQNELVKLGARISTTEASLELDARTVLNAGISIDTYNDHRMAMAFAPLGMITSLTINDAGVVSKSYPDYWEDLSALSFDIQEVV